MKNSRKAKQNFYQVEDIVDKKEENNIVKYKVKWKGFPLSESTWEPVENLSSVQELISKFEEKKKPALGKKRKRDETDLIKSPKKM
jgi:chromobox protein 1